MQVYFGACSSIATNEEHQVITAEGASSARLNFLKAGTTEQPVLEKRGDDVRIDWGYLYVAVPKNTEAIQFVTSAFEETDPFNNIQNQT